MYAFNGNFQLYGHLFTRDQTGTFVSIVDQVQTELDLVAANFDKNNISLAEDHANKASSLLPKIIGGIGEDSPQLVGELMRSVFGMENLSSTMQSKTQNISKIVDNLNQKLDKAKIVRIAQVQPDSNFLDKAASFFGSIFGGNASEQASKQVNSRINALAFADLMDAVLTNYGKAYDVSFDMTNMSNMVMVGNNEPTSLINMSNSMSSKNSTMDHMNMNMSMNMSSASMHNSSISMAQHRDVMKNDYQLVNFADYQTAQALTKNGLAFFNTELKKMTVDNKTIFVDKLDSGITHLNDSISIKAAPLYVMMIIHTEVHPNLLEAFNLQLRKQ